MNKMDEDEAIQTLRNHVCWVKSKNVKQAIETILDLYNKEKDSNQWLLKAFDESRNNNIELSKEYCKIQKELQQEKEKNKKITIKNHALKNESNVYGDEIVRLNNKIQEKQQEIEYLNCIIESDNDNYINKNKIREKLKELEEEQKEYKGSQEWEILDVINAQIDVLKEMLEEE